MPGPLPDVFPTMGAIFEKPYMEFEYKGEIHRLENLRGGHNGRVAAACVTNRPAFDEERGRWVVQVTNNIIDIDLTRTPANIVTPNAPPGLSSMNIVNNPRRSYRSSGILLTSGFDPQKRPEFPIDSEFLMHIRVKIPGVGTAINTKPFRLLAVGIDAWPPPVGTTYINQDDIELLPEWVPFGSTLIGPVARIRRGDQTVLIDVFPKPNGTPPRSFFRSIVNRLT